MWEIYLFFSNWFSHKRRESHTEELLSASELVLYYDLDTDLKERKQTVNHPDKRFDCNVKNTVTHFSTLPSSF